MEVTTIVLADELDVGNERQRVTKYFPKVCVWIGWILITVCGRPGRIVGWKSIIKSLVRLNQDSY